jgi:CHAT domain-containing protein
MAWTPLAPNQTGAGVDPHEDEPLSSLWSVDDAETARFMTDLYGQLKESKPAADAVRAAKLKMIGESKPPVFWAPFIFIGE